MFRHTQPSDVLFAELGLPPGALDDEIKSAYRNKAREHHPDKGGDAEAFRRINRARNILLDKTQKRLFDSSSPPPQSRGGPAEAKTTFGSGGDGTPCVHNSSWSVLRRVGKTIFMGAVNSTPRFRRDLAGLVVEMMGNMKLSRSGDDDDNDDDHKTAEHHHNVPSRPEPEEGFTEEAKRKRVPDEHFSLHITLEDLFTHAKKRLQITKSVQCALCRGQGHIRTVCGRCLGSGSHRPSLEGATTRVMCAECHSTGFFDHQPCSVCQGAQVTTVATNVTLSLHPGIDVRAPVRIHHVLDDIEDPALSATLIVQLVLDPHPRFQLYGDSSHLIVSQSITLVDSLAGCQLSIEHLDGSRLAVQIDDIVTPGHIHTIAGQGMWTLDGTTRGNLYVQFYIVYPTHKLSAENRLLLRNALADVDGEARKRDT